MTILSYVYRFVSNFAFLAVVYFTLNFLTKYEERTIIAALVLTYSIMRVVSVLRQFHFYSRIERLEAELRSAIMNVTDDFSRTGYATGYRYEVNRENNLLLSGVLESILEVVIKGKIVRITTDVAFSAAA